MVYNPKETYLNNLRSDIQSQIDNIQTGGVSGNFVTLDTIQNVQGIKTFIQSITISGENQPITGSNLVSIGNGEMVVSNTITISSNIVLGSNSQGDRYIQDNTFSDIGGIDGDIIIVINTGTTPVVTTTWTFSTTPLVDIENMYNIDTYSKQLAVGNDIWVLYDNYGNIWVSYDKFNWVKAWTSPYFDLYQVQTTILGKVIFDGTKFVLIENDNIGGGREVLTSTDGYSWNKQTDLTPNFSVVIGDLTYGSGVYVAVNNSTNEIITSTDLINWNYYNIQSSDYFWTNVTYGNGLFVAYGVKISTGKYAIIYSSNGSSWTLAGDSYSDAFKSIAFGNNIFTITISRISGETFLLDTLTSTNGADWTLTQTAIDFESKQTIFYNNLFVAGGQSTSFFEGLLTSPDGMSWTPVDGSVGLTFSVLTASATEAFALEDYYANYAYTI